MIKYFISTFSACILGFIFICQAQESIPAVIPGDFADPSVISDGKNYYAVGTSSEWAPHFPIYRSGDLQKWEPVGYVFDKAPEWTAGSFWAPEYYFMNGQYYIYYTARRKKDNISCMGVAVSKYPDHGFVDKGVIVDFGNEAIDAFIVEDKGQHYISFKAYGLDKRPIEILAMKLSADGLRAEGEVFSLLKDDARVGLEGQSFIKKDGYFYLFYSAGNCCGLKCDYNVQVARSKAFKGPYERFAQNPILFENKDWTCSGHGTFVQDKKGRYQYLYHAYNKESTVYTGRQGQLAELVWPEENGWPVYKQQAPVKLKSSAASIYDSFDGKVPALHWQWDWRHSSPVIQQSNNQLRLSGAATSNNPTGIVLTVRPSKADFAISTKLSGQSSALRGLAYYGDAGAALGLGLAGNQLQIWVVRDQQFTVLQSLPLQSSNTVELKLSVDTNHLCQFYYKSGKDDWQKVSTNKPVFANFLPQWDRSPRPGLHFRGNEMEYAIFTQFILE
ncbi:glycoside hydrolase family 43 protein [Flavihumibacter sp. UBA7668]|uniref:glycoside hydrolase family 43 protein n=1 Tax=Flavihumibacter sp. UBA7668 TaxID=1946542 RepID=UPI0025BD93BB|nr:glycoside hydrolase family 43 protein [Flavihumibacter sp. UBA7668]